MPVGIDIPGVIAALPGYSAVSITSPTYVGTLTSIREIVGAAHLGFLPRGGAVAQLRTSLRSIRGVVVLDATERGRPTDPMKITLWIPRTGVSGIDLAQDLWSWDHGVEAAEIIEAIELAEKLGRVAFNSDPSLQTIEVRDE